MGSSLQIGKSGIHFSDSKQNATDTKKIAEAARQVDSVGELNSLNRRVKMLEERYANLRSKFKLVEQNMLQKHKTFYTETKSINLELVETKKELAEIKDKLLLLVKELDSFAKKDSVKILKKYIDLWSPMNFVSRNELQEIIRDELERIRRGGDSP